MAEEFPHVHEEMLFESRRGFVRCCRACGAFELRFGNAILSMNAADLSALTDTVAAYDTGRMRPGSTPSDHAVIWLGHNGAGFRFRREEVAELHRLLAGARLFANLGQDEDPEDAPILEDPTDAAFRRWSPLEEDS
ncbi:MAG TPA: hypothetical protein DGD08_13160 [Gemmatimonas aurantiaca]|uniref:Uncharacterized protein n=2 Tax=Gemmatimonas aurantiaca TaxID=173480 RepID=C1ABG5_GEMAT|nr:hypothetical protein [Gemmatimonas aurantiaca]BAH39842.1 hypothetical protein GAU_2800 [Gemmatimonas aurantiaca T-27]HCT58147.1 hypothetical protein [Gemmatimonas aurantiaca]